MTREDIIRMATEAGLVNWEATAYANELSHFAKLVAEHERNEIIEILDASTGYVHMDAIRERGQT
jgi:hypothetical protein